jgi:F5/8 type C domain.
MTGDIVVYLRGGIYEQSSTLAFNENDSGNNGYRIYYKAYNNEVPVISGGKQITGWTQYNSNIYQATVTGISNRHLFVNDVRAQRAHTETALTNVSNWNDPNITDDPNHPSTEFNGIITNDSRVQYFSNPSDVELHWTFQWRDAYGPIASIVDGGNGYKIMKGNNPAFGLFFEGANDENYNNCTIENAFELLDQPGEFYYNKATSTMYYWPRSGENMSTATVYASQINGKLLSVEGSSLTSKVSNIVFYGITFAYASWISDVPGVSIEQAGEIKCTDYTNMVLPGNITVNNADGITFERNIIKHMGAAGINMEYNVTNSSIIGNKVYDISHSAISIGHSFVYEQGQLPAQYQVCYNIKVQNNYITQTGVEYWGGPGITGYTTDTLNISNNEIYDAPYSGISSGWGWFIRPNDYNKNNIIDNNRVRNILNKVNDGGGIYTLGYMSNIEIKNNYLADANATHGGQIYPDDTSSNQTISNNVLEDMNTGMNWLLLWSYNSSNINVSNTYTTTSTYENSGTNCTVTNTTTDANGSWPQAGFDIIADSGLQGQYRDLLPVADTVVSSTTDFTNFKAPNACDGYINTCWSSRNTSQTGAEWIYLRLPGYKNVTGVVLTPRGGVCFPVDFKFQYSDDGKTWTDVPGQSYTNYSQPSNQNPITFTFGSPVLTRYIRLYATKFGADSFGYYYMQLAEMGYTSSGNAPSAPPTGSRMWLKSDAGITKDASSYIGTWADQSGNGNNATQNTQSNKPMWYDNAVNMKPSIYSQNDDSMNASGVTGSMNNFTLSFVINPNNLRDYSNAIGATGGWGQFLFHGSANGTIYAGTSSSSRIVTASGILQTNKTQIYTYWFSNGSARLYKNGTLINSATLSNPSSWTGFAFFQVEGLLPEIILYNSALSDSDLKLLHAYLNNKYGAY